MTWYSYLSNKREDVINEKSGEIIEFIKWDQCNKWEGRGKISKSLNETKAITEKERKPPNSWKSLDWQLIFNNPFKHYLCFEGGLSILSLLTNARYID